MLSRLAVASAGYGVWRAELWMPMGEWLQLVFILSERGIEKPNIDKGRNDIALSLVSEIIHVG